jgi:two-component system LytT family response regulator
MMQERIRVLLVDDEPLARANLRVLLQDDTSIARIDECGSGQEAVEFIRSERPDLVFLDVQMPECDGFDVMELLGAEMPTAVVFVTAFDQYALKAFETGALDYLLKPFDDERLYRAVGRAKIQIAHYAQEKPSKALKRIVVKNAGSIVFLNPKEIDWIEAADYCVNLHVGARVHLLRRSMSDLDADLDPARFCRIHRSTIVNLARVVELSFDRDGEYEVVLVDGSRLRVSRRYHRALKDRMHG